MIYVNQVGANDELIFQGHSMVFNENGKMILKANDFEEDLIVYDTEKAYSKEETTSMDLEDELISACVLVSQII